MTTSDARGRKSRRRFRGTILTLVAGIFVLTNPSVAVAIHYGLEVDKGAVDVGEPRWYICNASSGNTYAHGCFEEDGDWIRVVDNEADGYRVGVQWAVEGAENGHDRYGLCWTNAGSNGSLGYRWCNKNFPEDDLISIRAGRCDVTAMRDCLHPNHFVDWSAWDAART